MFNVTTEGEHVEISADLPDPAGDWSLGLIVGPSGSGKSTLGREVLGPEAYSIGSERRDWPDDLPVIDAIDPDGSFDSVTSALSAVGLGDVPAWLRPHRVLSTGEAFRADLARVVAEAPAAVVIDEFTSVVDRQIAKVGASAFAKAWRRTGGKAVALSCHYDIAEWLCPDWVYDTSTGLLTWECLRRPPIEVRIRQVPHEAWGLFKPHHYLDVGPMPFSVAYIAEVNDEPVAHLGVSSKSAAGAVEARACRMVVLPEWQGAGLGLRFLNHVCLHYYETGGHLGRPCTTQFHTSHPGLIAALLRRPEWRRISSSGPGYGTGVKALSALSIAAARNAVPSGGFGGHLRSVTGFRYYGPVKK